MTWAVAERRIRQAYHAESTLMVERDKTRLGAAVGLWEGMAETLSILRLVEHPPGLRAALDQPDRVNGRDLPGALQER